MTISWPPYGRWAAGYGTDEKALSWVPKTQIAGKVGYALPPGGHPQLAAGFALQRRCDQQEQGAGLSVHPVAEQRGHQPRAGAAALRAARPVPRDSTSPAPEYKAAGPRRRNISAALQAGAVDGLLDLSLLQTDKYEEALRQGCRKLWAGEDPKAILDQAAAQWDAITERIGVDKQKAAYEAWASKPSAYPTAT